MTNSNKITYIANSQFPNQSANNIHIFNMAKAMHEAGFLNELVTRTTELFSAKASELSAFERIFAERPQFRYRRLRSIRGLRDYDYNIYLTSYIRRFNVSQVYTRALNVAYLVLRSGVPTSLVLELHEPPRTAQEISQFEFVCCHKDVRRIVFITKSLCEFVSSKFGLRDSLVDVLPDCASEPCLSQSEAQKLILKYANRNLDVCYVGHLYPGKADILLEIAKQSSNVLINIFGGAEVDISRFSRLMLENNIKNIHLHGHVNYQEARFVMGRAKILLMPYSDVVQTKNGSDAARWMSPLKMYEYMMSKSLVISSDLPVIREVLNEGNSVLLAPTDHVGWASAIEHELDRFDSSDPRIQTAFKASVNWTWQHRVKKVASYFISQ